MRRIVRYVAVLLLAAAVFVAVSWISEPPGRVPFPGGHPLLVAAAEGGWTVWVFVAEHPRAPLVLMAVVAVPLLCGFVASHLPRRVRKDPQRLFSAEQRRMASELAGGRCEMDGFLLFTRCRRTGNAGDHWFPHSKGGATDMANQVWACTPCNSSKSAHVPSPWQTMRLEWRRRRYFPAHVTRRPGSRYGRPAGVR